MAAMSKEFEMFDVEWVDAYHGEGRYGTIHFWTMSTRLQYIYE